MPKLQTINLLCYTWNCHNFINTIELITYKDFIDISSCKKKYVADEWIMWFPSYSQSLNGQKRSYFGVYSFNNPA